MRWHKYVAVGDSFTEGLDDPYPDASGYRGWADLVAQRLAAEAAPRLETKRATEAAPRRKTDSSTFHYANLAVRGRMFGNIVAEQVPVALAMEPDLVSFAAGGNDVLRRNFDPVALITQFDKTIATFRETGADVVLFRFADVTRRLPGRRMILPRVEVLNRAVGETAERHGAHLVDLWHDDEFLNPRLWSIDRLHLSSVGHRRVAAHVLQALGLPPEPDWLATSAPPDPIGWVAARTADARWAAQHLAPWVKRRLTGRSSGDAVSAKRPSLDPLSW